MNKKNLLIGLLIFLALIAFLKKDYLAEKVPELIFGEQQYKEDVLIIVLNTSSTNLSPYSTNLNNAIRVSNIYEGLVAFDRNLKIIPALAVSWGNINPTTWEFKLRRDVLFHDRSPFTAESVLENFTELQGRDDNPIPSVKEIKILSPYQIQIITESPDPLLLSKLTKFRINRPENIGTGPYKYREWVPEQVLSLTVFTDYWGGAPAYRNAEYRVIANKAERKNGFERGDIDILVAVPRDQALELPKGQVKTSYSLEVNFLMFKLDDERFKDRAVREALRQLFDPARIEAIGNHFVRQATQFVAPGVYGYNPEIPPLKYPDDKKIVPLFGDRMERIKFDYLSSYRTLSEYLEKQLNQAGFSVKMNPTTPQELIDLVQKNASQLFLIGWQAEDGDAGGFLDAFIHSKGQYNGGRYANPEVDQMIEESRSEMNPQKRLSLLQNIMKKVNDDLIGVPLFESSRLYAVQRDVRWEPRLDGLVLAAEVE